MYSFDSKINNLISEWHDDTFSKKLLRVIVTIYFVIFALLSFFHYTFLSSEKYSVVVIILFIFPVLFSGVVLSTKGSIVRSYYIYLVIYSNIFHFIGWSTYLAYVISGTSKYVFLFFITGIIVTFLIIIAILITSWIIIKKFEQSLDGVTILKRQMKANPGASLSLFISLFLSTTFILSLSFAFYNLHEPGSLEGPKATTSIREGPLPNSDVDTTNWQILFTKGSSQLLEFDSEDWFIGNAPQDIQEEDDDDDKTDNIIGNLNRVTLSNLCAQMNQLRRESKLVRMHLIGHTSKERVLESSADYSSNYELGEARAQRVMLRLWNCQSADTTRDAKSGYTNSKFQWHVLSASYSGDSPQEFEDNRIFTEFSDDATSNRIRDKYADTSYWPNTNRSVEVIAREFPPSTEVIADNYQSQPTGRLNLLDYIYFTTYTITTTGYGDIRPADPVMKGMTILTNFIEVLFIAIFFNLFLAFAYRDDDGDDSRQSNRSDNDGKGGDNDGDDDGGSDQGDTED